MLNTTEINLAVAPGETQTTWDDPDGVIVDFTVHPIRAGYPGEITYIGTPLDVIVGQIGDANYSFVMNVMGTRNLRLDLRIRRKDENNFIALKVDFPTDYVYLVEVVNGVETILDQRKRTFNFRGVRTYTFEIWTIGRFLYGFVNDFNAVRASTKNHRTEPGFSLNFPTIDGADLPAIADLTVGQTSEQAEESLPDDPSNLYLQFRLQIKEEIENPTEYTWASYQRALKLYEQREAGAPDAVWESLGYPIRKPSPEEWFGGPE
jgi:hypothetical protein